MAVSITEIAIDDYLENAETSNFLKDSANSFIRNQINNISNSSISEDNSFQQCNSSFLLSIVGEE